MSTSNSSPCLLLSSFLPSLLIPFPFPSFHHPSIPFFSSFPSSFSLPLSLLSLSLSLSLSLFLFLSFFTLPPPPFFSPPFSLPPLSSLPLSPTPPPLSISFPLRLPLLPPSILHFSSFFICFLFPIFPSPSLLLSFSVSPSAPPPFSSPLPL